ncbi:uncharacterized protein LOC130677006 [Microplitis mediator]|uniref:uncharacterized protein LOC130677006 n=1 Tax=Microplitis mediator TaxID=375433 RepID=UPI0025550746|nr:uncharacterized protein LOC130677006 [Microplitis mediator]
MIIKTTCPNFQGKYFEILDYKNELTVFIWENDDFIYFPLSSLTSTSTTASTSTSAATPADKNSNSNYKIIRAPNEIKKIESFNGRIFIICRPRGIYKFVNNNSNIFASLSTTALDITTEFYKILIIKNNYLYLQDKQQKYSTELFYLNNNKNNIDSFDTTIDISNSTIDTSKLSTINTSKPSIFDTSKSKIDLSQSQKKNFSKIQNSNLPKIDISKSQNIDLSKSQGNDPSSSQLIDQSTQQIINISNLSTIDINCIKIDSNEITNNLKNIFDDNEICLITFNNLLFKLINNKTQLIFTSNYSLTDFILIKNNNNKINNLLLKTTNKKLLILITGNYIFKKIFFNYDVNNCAGFIDGNEDFINLVIGSDKIYFVTLKISTGVINYVSCINDQLNDVKIYDNKIYGLKSAGELAVIETEFKFKFEKMAGNSEDEFFELRASMCSGTTVIVDNICDLSKQLKEHNDKLLIEQDKLKRINIYAHKSKLVGVKKIWVERTSCCIFLKACFECALPRDCWIHVAVDCKGQEFFSMQIIEDGEVGAEIPLPVDYFDATADITVDLVTLVEENDPWFIVKNCVKKTSAKEKENIKGLMEKKKNFLNTKLGTLRSFRDEDKNFNKICGVKKSLRREIKDF